MIMKDELLIMLTQNGLLIFYIAIRPSGRLTENSHRSGSEYGDPATRESNRKPPNMKHQTQTIQCYVR
jgi:hypothetical protein